MAQPTYNHIDFMYTALVADGSQIPAVIFTSDPNVPEGIEGDVPGFIVHIPNLSSTPSGDITERWLDVVGDYLDDEPHLIHDAGGEFSSKKITEKFQEKGIIDHKIPGAGGAFLNPCDNNFHHDMKHHFYAKTRRTHNDMLVAMLQSYSEVPDENIVNYFTHCKLTTTNATRRQVSTLISEGYRPGRNHEEMHERCQNAYAAWKKNIRLLNNSVRENYSQHVDDDSTLDGVYWYPHYNF